MGVDYGVSSSLGSLDNGCIYIFEALLCFEVHNDAKDDEIAFSTSRSHLQRHRDATTSYQDLAATALIPTPLAKRGGTRARTDAGIPNRGQDMSESGNDVSLQGHDALQTRNA